MPIYEYKCRGCGHKFEELVLGEEEIKCPKCNSKELEKLPPSNVSIRRKGDNDFGSCPTGTCPFSK